MSSSRGKVEIMPQDMVAGSLRGSNLSSAADAPPSFPVLRRHIWPHRLHLIRIGNVKQTPSPYTPKYILLKIPYRFNTGYQLLARSSACVRCDWSLSQDLQRSRP